MSPSEPDSIAGRLIAASAVWPAVAWHRDDTFIIIALVFAVANSIISGLQTRNGAGHHISNVPATDFARFMKLGSIGGSLTYNLATLFIKLSLLSLFLRFSRGLVLRGVIYLLMLITLGYTVANAFIWTYLCTPMAAAWDFTVQGSCMDPWPPFVSNGALNVGTDVLILMVAVWVVWEWRVGMMQKVGVGLMMVAGAFVCVVSILRLAVLLRGDGTGDATWEYTTNLIWILCEMYTGIICACLPCLRAFTKHFFPNWIIFRDDFEEQLASRAKFFSNGSARGSASLRRESQESSVEEVKADVRDGSKQV
ncbi:hypothetical protein QBC34DRAFT_436238 [Podospora aff. communis PSN243]|uniref:Rhodopsin domain-containing protein n=1 Tax=Podospora aff. communis PSN243 TaxID=3040156 RepID=A0AAV9GUM4_9PEZI|nr:hypothetical protein QBC34DRAFT_436238 [Podospora aff. communis PSN243]